MERIHPKFVIWKVEHQPDIPQPGISQAQANPRHAHQSRQCDAVSKLGTVRKCTGSEHKQERGEETKEAQHSVKYSLLKKTVYGQECEQKPVRPKQEGGKRCKARLVSE